MVSLTINPDLKRAAPGLALGCVSAKVTIEKHNGALWQEIERHLSHLSAGMKSEQINSIRQIAAMRSAYKALGKDPSRYRGSAEALLRRVLSGKGLYQINSIVDINNLVSLESFLPLGSYDMDRIEGAVELRVGATGETYKGIGKDEIKIENLPVFADAKGPFGSPTSDSERAMVQLETRNVLMTVFSFTGPEQLKPWTDRCLDLMVKHAGAQEVESSLVI